MTQAHSVCAHFEINRYPLTVVTAGNGSVTSSPSGIDCSGSGSGCSADYNHGTVVTLTANLAAGQLFTGWSGACSGSSPTCTVTMNEAKSVAANFNVAVREWNDQIIFLRKIVSGGTDKSYGIQVARLAGVPRLVLDRAKEILSNLEESELTPAGRARSSSRQRERDKLQNLPPPPQLDLFQ